VKTYPPRPQSRPDNLGLWGRLGAYRRDLFGSQPERLYSAKIARSKTPLFTSFFVNVLDANHYRTKQCNLIDIYNFIIGYCFLP